MNMIRNIGRKSDFHFHSKPVSSPPVTLSRVTRWLNSCNREFNNLHALGLNGSCSLLKREITKIAPLLQEAEELINNASASPQLQNSIRLFVQPQYERLNRVYTSAVRKCNDPNRVKEDAGVERKWRSLGLPLSVLQQHADCARFLVNSGLIYTILGYRETAHNSSQHDLKLDADGHPLIKVQGHWKRWEEIKTELTYDSATYQIKSRAYSGSIVQNWTYLSPQGLVPVDRMRNEQLLPIYQLNPVEYQRVLTHAHRFYETNPEVDRGERKECVIQFFTTPRRQFFHIPIPKGELFDNLAKNGHSHITMRIIQPNGDVYSFGIEMTAESHRFLLQGFNFLGTTTATINKAGDYEEFRPHEGRIITSIPLTRQRAQNVLELVTHLGKEEIRFHFLKQNCSNLMRIIFQEIGYSSPNNRMTVSQYHVSSLPDIRLIPSIGPLLDRIHRSAQTLWKGICNISPEPVRHLYSAVTDTALYIPRIMRNIVLNCILLSFGAGRMHYPLPEGVEEDVVSNPNRLTQFSRLIPSWWDMIKEEPQIIYHSKQFIDWQRKQHSTFVDPYSGRPKLSIVPPAASH